MRKFSIYYIVIFISLSLLLSCGKKDEKTDVKKDEKKEVKKEFVSGFYCKIDGKDFTIPDSVSYVRKDDKSFSIYAVIDIQNGQYDDFFFYIETPIKTGDFVLSKDNKPGHVQYRTNKDKPADAEYVQFWSDNGKLTLTKVDEKGIEGTFNVVLTGTVNDVEKKINITDGKIKVAVK